jgi:HAD superfamily hydrolase (TIGR01509 family)
MSTDSLFARSPAALRAAYQAANPKPLPPVAGLLFDVGDVLYDATIWRRWLLKLLRRFGIAQNYDEFFRVWEHEYLDAVCRGQRNYEEAFESLLVDLGLTYAQIDEVEAAAHARRRLLAADIRPLPNVRTTIERLRQSGLVLGVLSDFEFPSTFLAERLARMKLGQAFSVILSSLDLERTKPDPDSYHAALSAMGLEPALVAFVGHDAEELAGAREIGMPTIAFNFEPGAQADVYLQFFHDLLTVVVPRADEAAQARSRSA